MKELENIWANQKVERLRYHGEMLGYKVRKLATL